MVDLLDFPIDPPNADEARGGGRDFGGGGRYGKYHTGEDWGLAYGSSFGAPVYSIGHGRVTYAQPRGWGADKGVVIVRHTFSDGSTILSFYGHLHPPSVVLDVADCVVRGGQVGEIGKPRTSPHLHFEIRSHMPTEPGPGYWPVDPTLAGWEPPSQFIWNQRIATSPGVQWMWPPSSRFTKALGMLNRDTLAAIEDDELIGINVLDGSLRWRQPSSDQRANALVNANNSVIYVINQSGQLEAFRLPEPQDSGPSSTSEPGLVLMWKMELDAITTPTLGGPTLMPLPAGGVVISARQLVFNASAEGQRLSVQQQMFGVSAGGRLLWEFDLPDQPVDWTPRDDHWTLTDDRLIFTTSGRDTDLWTIDESGPTAWAAQISGIPVISGDGLFLYDQEGVYRLNPETRSAELLYALPRAYPGLGDMVALPDGGLLLAHTDWYDKRLIVLDNDGTLRWQRSFSNVAPGQPRLHLLDGQPFVILQNDTAYATDIAIFAIDMDRAELTHIFTGGTRTPKPEDTSTFAIDNDRLLINIGGGSMVALDTQLSRYEKESYKANPAVWSKA